MSLKKLLVSALCAACAVSLMIPVAFAHGGHGRAARGWQSGTSRYAVCPVEDCTLTGRHVHNGVTYCGANHAAGYCGGNCPYTTGTTTGTWGVRGGCHGGGRHCGW